MEYHFKRQETFTDPLIFALSLDHKGTKERILIGTETAIARTLWGEPVTDVLYDRTGQLGGLLIDFRQNSWNSWTDRGFMPLWNALHTNRFRQPGLEQSAAEFLQGEYSSGSPLSIYAALRLWDGYLRARQPRDRDMAAERYRADLLRLIQPLAEYPPEKLRSRDFPSTLRQSDSEMKLELWYPSKTGAEFVTCYGSFLPVFLYYHNRLREWGLFFRKCKVCGRTFLAKSLKYEICSDKCRKAKNRQNKRAFDERAKENSYDRIYKNECQHWRNIIRKAENTADFPAERLSSMKLAFESFKKEALQRKSAVKNGTSALNEFEDWILLQSAILDKI